MRDTLKLVWNGIESAYEGFPLGVGCVVGFVCFLFAMLYLTKQKKQEECQIGWKDLMGVIVFTLYMVLLLGGTLLCREMGEMHRIEMCLFWSYWETFVKHNMALWHQMLYNVLIFIPWGIILPFLFKARKKGVVITGAAFLSFLIELIQLFFKLGLFELDDIFHNTVGAILGYGIYVICRKIKEQVRECVC